MRYRFLSLILIILLIQTTTAQDTANSTYISSLQPTEDPSVLLLNVKADKGMGTIYYNYSSDELVSEITAYTADSVLPESQFYERDIIEVNGTSIDASRTGSSTDFTITTEGGSIYNLDDNGILNSIPFNDLDFSAFLQTNDIGIAVSAYYALNDTSYIFMFSRISDQLYSTNTFNFKVDLSSLTYIEHLSIISIPKQGSNTAINALLFYVDVQHFGLLQDTSDKDYTLFDAYDKVISSITVLEGENTTSKLDITTLNPITQYTRTFTSSELEANLTIATKPDLLPGISIYLSTIALTSIVMLRYQSKRS